jgi:hypothetical protein
MDAKQTGKWMFLWLHNVEIYKNDSFLVFDKLEIEKYKTIFL